jgi:putative phosphoribosyl transferase
MTATVAIQSREVRIPVDAAELAGTLSVPDDATGIVLFAHGSGSSRHSSRNVYVARTLHDAHVGTLLFDLLTAQEEARDVVTREYRFDIPLLAQRLIVATEWLDRDRRFAHARLGYFGASTGSAAALIAAAELRDRVAAVVSRGGRPDLAGQALARVRAPTLLIVGGADHGVIELNELALERLRGTKQIAIVPGASHLFEEPGTLTRAAELASQWFVRHLSAASGAP